MQRRLILSCILIVVFLGGALGAFAWLRATRPPVQTAEPHRPPLVVTAIQVWPAQVTPMIEGFGTARAARLAAISAEVAGVLVERPSTVQEGAAVSEGDLLLRVDARDYEAALVRARSMVELSEAALAALDVQEQNLERLIRTAREELLLTEREYERVVDLFERGASNPRELDGARLALQGARRTLDSLEGERDLLGPRRAQERAALSQRRADVDIAALNLQRCEIRAPFTGRIATLEVDAGERVAPGQPLLTLLDPRLVEIPLELATSVRPRIRVGARATLQLESRRAARWEGTVARISPQASSASRTFQLFVEVANREEAAAASTLVPGMFVRAEVEGLPLDDVLMIPRNALRQGRVFLVADGRALSRSVEVLETLREQAIVAGIEPGAVVVTSNLEALHDGMPIEPLLATAAGPAAPAGAASAAPPAPAARTP